MNFTISHEQLIKILSTLNINVTQSKRESLLAEINARILMSFEAGFDAGRLEAYQEVNK